MQIISNKCRFNPKNRQFFPIQFWLFSLEFNYDVDFSFLHRRRVDFITPRLVVSRLHGCYAEIPGLLVPDSFSFFCFVLLLLLLLFFSDRSTDPKSENALDNKRKKGGNGLREPQKSRGIISDVKKKYISIST